MNNLHILRIIDIIVSLLDVAHLLQIVYNKENKLKEKIMNIYICDNNNVHLEYTADFIHSIKKQFSQEIECRPLLTHELIDLLDSKEFRANIMVLDISMPEANGIDLAKRINQAYPECHIIFLTGYIDYAPFVYSTEHTYFVLKPQMRNMLPLALEKSLKLLNTEEKTLSLMVNNHKFTIPLNRIYFIEKRGHYAMIHTSDNSLQALCNLKEFPNLLGSDFIRCHGGYIINMQYVETFNRNNFTLKDKTIIPIGRTFQKTATDAYVRYISSRL